MSQKGPKPLACEFIPALRSETRFSKRPSEIELKGAETPAFSSFCISELRRCPVHLPPDISVATGFRDVFQAEQIPKNVHVLLSDLKGQLLRSHTLYLLKASSPGASGASFLPPTCNPRLPRFQEFIGWA